VGQEPFPDPTKPARQRRSIMGKSNVWPGRATGAQRSGGSLLAKRSRRHARDRPPKSSIMRTGGPCCSATLRNVDSLAPRSYRPAGCLRQFDSQMSEAAPPSELPCGSLSRRISAPRFPSSFPSRLGALPGQKFDFPLERLRWCAGFVRAGLVCLSEPHQTPPHIARSDTKSKLLLDF
jgi:hypothetical protein